MAAKGISMFLHNTVYLIDFVNIRLNLLKAAVYKIIFKIFTNCLYNKEDIRKIRKSKILQILQNFGHVTSVDWCFTLSCDS